MSVSKRRRKRRQRRRFEPGAPPGAFQIDPNAQPTSVRVIAYGPESVTEHPIDDVAELRKLLGTRPVVWVDVVGLGDEKVLRALGEVFSIHPLALADIVNVGQRPKVELYGEHLFTICRMIHLGERVEDEQFSLLTGEGFVLSFQEYLGDCLDPVRRRIRKGLGRVRNADPGHLLYALLDAVIDSYFPVLEQYGERVEDLEDQVLANPDHNAVTRIHAVKRDLLALRRAIWPQRDAINWLLREPSPRISDETRIYLRDCYDHISQIIDMVETHRELASGLLDVYMTGVSHRMNEVMKVLTIIATIFIPLTFLAGVYGMNFDRQASPWNMPELGWYYGYPLALGAMALIAVVMVLYFWRKGWLRRPEPLETKPAHEEGPTPPAGNGRPES